MKLWLLHNTKGVDYDEYDGFVVRAETEQKARELVSKKAGGEGAETWLNPKYSTCVDLQKVGEPEIILGSFNAG